MKYTQKRTIIRFSEAPDGAVSSHLDQLCAFYGRAFSKFLWALQTRELREEVLYRWRLRSRLTDALALDDLGFGNYVSQLVREKRKAEAALLNYLRTQKTYERYLQTHHWQLALQEAAECMKTYWAAVCSAARRSLAQCTMPQERSCEEERHYYNWVLNPTGKQFFYLMNGRVPDPTVDGLKRIGFDAETAQSICTFAQAPIRLRYLASHARKRVARITQTRVRAPGLKAPADRIKFSKTCWRMVVKDNVQTVHLTSLIPYRRIPVTLKGCSAFRGTAQLLKRENGYEFRVFKALECEPPRTEGESLGIDIGYTEVLTTSKGERFGEGFGKLISEYADRRCDKGRRRNKLHALVRKKLKIGTKKQLRKARNIREHNLGRKRQREALRREKEQLKTLVNQALNKLLRSGVKTIVVEKLAAAMRSCYTKAVNRKLSSWLRGYIRERIAFKSKVYGVDVVEVNPAYT
jgi:IS605 OrfB family transposase